MSNSDEFIQKLKNLNVKEQRELIHVKRFYENQWNHDKEMKVKDRQARLEKSTVRKYRAKVRLEKLKEAKIRDRKKTEKSLKRFQEVQGVKRARIQKELNFEATVREARAVERDRLDQSLSREMNSGIGELELQIKRLGLSGGDSNDIVPTQEDLERARRTDPLEHLRLLSEREIRRAGNRKSESDAYNQKIQNRIQKNREATSLKKTRVHVANLQQRRDQEEAERLRHERSELETIVSTMSQERDAGFWEWHTEGRNRAEQRVKVLNAAVIRKVRDEEYDQILKQDAIMYETLRREKIELKKMEQEDTVMKKEHHPLEEVSRNEVDQSLLEIPTTKPLTEIRMNVSSSFELYQDTVCRTVRSIDLIRDLPRAVLCEDLERKISVISVLGSSRKTRDFVCKTLCQELNFQYLTLDWIMKESESISNNDAEEESEQIDEKDECFPSKHANLYKDVLRSMKKSSSSDQDCDSEEVRKDDNDSIEHCMLRVLECKLQIACELGVRGVVLSDLPSTAKQASALDKFLNSSLGEICTYSVLHLETELQEEEKDTSKMDNNNITEEYNVDNNDLEEKENNNDIGEEEKQQTIIRVLPVSILPISFFSGFSSSFSEKNFDVDSEVKNKEKKIYFNTWIEKHVHYTHKHNGDDVINETSWLLQYASSFDKNHRFKDCCSVHLDAAVLRKQIPKDNRDTVFECVSELKEKIQSLVKTRASARQVMSLEIQKYEDAVSYISRTLLEGSTQTETWNARSIFEAWCASPNTFRDAVNAAWDKVQSNLKQLEKCLENACCNMSKLKDSFVDVAKQAIERIDEEIESNSKTRSYLLDIVGVPDNFVQDLGTSSSSSSVQLNSIKNEFVTPSLESRIQNVVSSFSSKQTTISQLIQAYDRFCCLHGVIYADHITMVSQNLKRLCSISDRLQQHSENLLREYARDESHALDKISACLSTALSSKYSASRQGELLKNLESIALELSKKRKLRVGFSFSNTDD